MIEQLLAWKVVVIGGWLALFFVLERVLPASPWKPEDPARQFSQRRHLAQNASFWLINLLLSPLLVIAFTAVAVDHGLQWRQALFAPLPIWAALAFDLLILDLWIYSWHRLNHRLPFFWRFHRVHHLDQQLDATSALRFHYGELILSAVLRMPVIFLFAMPLSSVVVFETLVVLVAIFHHANVRLPPRLERGLSRVVITPSIHWVHHHAVRRDTDSNYGTILSCWDRLFRSLSPSRRTPTMVLGVENMTENRVGRLLVLPFSRQ